MSLLAATGLRREARIISGPGVIAVAGAGRSASLEAALLAAAPGAAAIISIGLAGALAPELQPGAWVVARRVISHGGGFPTDPDWTDALLRALPSAREGAVLGMDAMLTERVAKQGAYAATDALAVDMESHVAARVAQRLGLRFAVARTISDAADRSLPPLVSVGLAPDGRMALAPVLAALARDPGQTLGLVRTGLEAARAFRALARGRRLLGPRLGLPDLGQLPLDMR